MRRLANIDFVVQSSVIGFLCILFFLFSFTGHFRDMTWFASFSLAFIVLWQIISSALFAAAPYRKLRIAHVVAIAIYVCVLVPTGHIYSRHKSAPLDIFLFTWVLGIPPALVLFYYYITYKSRAHQK